MSGVLLPELDLRDTLSTVLREGAAYLPRALDEAFRRRLQEEIRGLPFEAVPEEVGPVRQETELFLIREPMDAHPAVAALRDALLRLVREEGQGIRGLATYRPNEASVQRYRPRALGITPHLDGKRFRRLVAVFTAEGTARFVLCRDRSGPVVASWEAGPGSLLLLRAPGLGGLRDGRPFHAVEGPRRGTRYSVSFRMNARPDGR